MHVHITMRVCICMYTCMYICSTLLCVCVCICMYVCMYICINMKIHTYTHTQTNTHTHRSDTPPQHPCQCSATLCPWVGACGHLCASPSLTSTDCVVCVMAPLLLFGHWSSRRSASLRRFWDTWYVTFGVFVCMWCTYVHTHTYVCNSVTGHRGAQRHSSDFGIHGMWLLGCLCVCAVTHTYVCSLVIEALSVTAAILGYMVCDFWGVCVYLLQCGGVYIHTHTYLCV